jgi:glycosyltransferase involved in cell wall biosynthesis
MIIADAFPPMQTSAAVHMHELALELIRQGHDVTAITSTALNKESLKIDHSCGYRLVLVYAPMVRNVSYIRRALSEFISPYIMYFRLRSNPIFDEYFEGIIWYSPTIFFGPLVMRLKVRYACPAYLVLRDMFPDWAVDLGLIKKGLPYYFLKLVELRQYKVASFIGIQAPGNFKYFEVGPFKKFASKVELLWTWITPVILPVKCSIDLSKTTLTGRINFVYAGNMGIAQDFDFILSLADLYKNRSDIGFVFIGRGSEVERLKVLALKSAMKNVLFFDEIDSIEISTLYAQCSIGLVALDPRHKSNNIPGKFLSYIESGLPVLARLNPGNDLEKLISNNQVGMCYTGSDIDEFKIVANKLIEMLQGDQNISIRCKNLAHTFFSTENAAIQIVSALKREN